MRHGRRDLVQFVFRCCGRGAETALGTLRGLSGLSLPKGLQFERPLGGLGPWTHLDLLAGVLKAEHLDFYGVGSRRETRQFVGARLVRGGHHPMVAESRSYRGSGQRLAAKLDGSRVGEAGLRVQRRTESQK